MKLKIFSLLLLILAACSDVPEIKPSPPYGANGYQCGRQYYDWTYYSPDPFNQWSGLVWSGNNTAYLNTYWKPTTSGQNFIWPTYFSAIVRIYNQGKCKFRVTPAWAGYSQDVSVGGYADFYYYWDPSVLGNVNCVAQISYTNFPINISFQRLSCGSSAGSPQPGYYVFHPLVDVISMTNGQAFSTYTDAGYDSSTGSCTN